MTTSVVWPIVLAAVLVTAPAVGIARDEPLYVLEGESIYRVVPGSEDVKVADDVGPGIATALSALPRLPSRDRSCLGRGGRGHHRAGRSDRGGNGCRVATVSRSNDRLGSAPWVAELHESAVAAFEDREYRPVLLNGDPIRLRIAVALVYNPPVEPEAPSTEADP